MPPSLDTISAVQGDTPLSCKAVKQLVVPRAHHPAIGIMDIRQATVDMNLRDEILAMFSPAKGPRMLPTLLLYNETGLQLFEEVGLPHTGHILRDCR